MRDLWPLIEPLLAHVERPARYIDREWNAPKRPEAVEFSVALAYPDTYEVGQPNNAIAILGSTLNTVDGVYAERAFLPWVDMADLLREKDIPLFSIESCAPLRDFDMLGITLPHEMAGTNVLELLDLAQIPLHSNERTLDHPFVIGGGPCTYNPEPFAPFFDAILIGEGEEAILEIAQVLREAKGSREGTDGKALTREEVLERLAGVTGVYVPSLYEQTFDERGEYAGTLPRERDGEPLASEVVTKRVVRDFSSTPGVTKPIVPFMEVIHDRHSVEILRGCSRGCRFCQAGMVYRPVRERTADEVVSAAVCGLACGGHDEVALTSLSSTDHSQIEQILRRLNKRFEGTGTGISLPSQRLDSFGISMARLVSGTRKSGLTFAPEAGTQRLRDIINKGVTEEDLFTALDQAMLGGWRRVKLYFMIGLPGETDEDVLGIADLANRVLVRARELVEPAQRGGIKISVSVSTFVPKASTPFEWDPQIPFDEIDRKHALLRENIRRGGIDLHYHDSRTSFAESVVAIGGREVAGLIEAAWREGARFDAWTEQFSLDNWTRGAEKIDLDMAAIANTPRDPEKPLPWDHISAGVTKRYLLRERERAQQGTTTPDCTFAECTGCGVCPDLDVDIVLAGGSR